MKVAIWTANILGWPVIHLLIARIVLGMPARSFANDGFLFALRPWEQQGDFYRRRFALRSWKKYLPDGAPWLGGFPKKRLKTRDQKYIENFIVETRRAEFAHWCMLFCFPIFFLWNPPWACLVMTVYAIVANIPCIVVQRCNRFVLVRLRCRRYPQ